MNHTVGVAILLLALGSVVTSPASRPILLTGTMSASTPVQSGNDGIAIIVTSPDYASSTVTSANGHQVVIQTVQSGTYIVRQSPPPNMNSPAQENSPLLGDARASQLEKYAAILSQRWPILGMSHRKNRNRLEIYARIIEISTFDPVTVSQLGLYLRMNFKETKETVNFLISKGLIQQEWHSSTCYRATSRGVIFAEQARRTLRFIA